MEKIIISGGKKLKGDVTISGAKNAAVAVIPATLLVSDICRIENIPSISDITLMCKIMSEMGANIRMVNKNTLEIDTRKVASAVVSCDLIRNMRASFYITGALLGRFSKAAVSLPGGCNFGGIRPIDQHLKGFTALGANCKLDGGVVHVSSEKLIGNNIYLDVVSVGATVNIMLAAVKADGCTVIENAAKEPHIVDLANFLNCMGANVCGAGTDIIKVHGVKKLNGITYSIIPDQIEAGTYMVAAAATKGDVTINNVTPKHLESITAKLEEIGVSIEEKDESLRVYVNKDHLIRCNVKTLPYPGFPTDMQPQITALLSTVNGTSIVSEGVWDNRFGYVEELRRMGAQISVDGKMAVIEGVQRLKGATVRAPDLRAGAALITAGLCADGTTIIEEISHIERGYENIIEKLRSLGANIKKVTFDDDPINSVAKAL
ncbi:MAG: UDP-N-acetylglucosamine 1-carboxyvinyltransferase [Oscillospiraceae bacterium]|nr:UDP-N-acetylglucosamine 1-carboxyvinyltransferase [Oscillospiraceae bacterium]